MSETENRQKDRQTNRPIDTREDLLALFRIRAKTGKGLTDRQTETERHN